MQSEFATGNFADGSYDVLRVKRFTEHVPKTLLCELCFIDLIVCAEQQKEGCLMLAETQQLFGAFAAAHHGISDKDVKARSAEQVMCFKQSVGQFDFDGKFAESNLENFLDRRRIINEKHFHGRSFREGFL
jgi:hypothetical protein